MRRKGGGGGSPPGLVNAKTLLQVKENLAAPPLKLLGLLVAKQKITITLLPLLCSSLLHFTVK